MRSFYIIWRDEQTKHWWPVGKLIDFSSMFAFVYLKGAIISKNFRLFPGFQQTNAVYLSNDLFPVFKNRTLNKNRPDFATYANWSGHDVGFTDSLALMGTMGGDRATDMLQVYPVPKKNVNGNYETTFFCHGIGHLPNFVQKRVMELSPGDTLYPMLDPQNPFDQDAVALRTEDPTCLVGYCPRHLCFDIKDLMQKYRNNVDIEVVRVNFDAPTQFKLLCKAVSKWPTGFNPCDREVYKPLIDYRRLLEDKTGIILE